MSTEKPVSELSMEELQAKAKSMRGMLNLWIVIMTLMILAAIANTVLGGFSIFTVLPLFFAGIFVLNYNNWKKVKAEIDKRSKH
ncbi:MAG: hypothetical protein SFV55_26685 [Haliscomenobacter sp.]|uniref:hypothetical protein n=1 Tax=Haliscomenobacter sp. TaxID=2717303 RepID=UPI0029A94E8B|nr:hypothetical protein [Haliscomenobacter sp.]MDX2072049.1 hypothetical protein [Haliscomenobacter sp.]